MSENGEFNLEEAMAEYRRIIDEREALNEQLKGLNERKDVLDNKFASFSEATGLESFAGSGLAISVAEKMRATYDPQTFDQLLKWAGENNSSIIQRRLSDARIIELVESGAALPPGVNLEPYVSVSYRRRS